MAMVQCKKCKRSFEDGKYRLICPHCYELRQDKCEKCKRNFDEERFPLACPHCKEPTPRGLKRWKIVGIAITVCLSIPIVLLANFETINILTARPSSEPSGPTPRPTLTYKAHNVNEKVVVGNISYVVQNRWTTNSLGESQLFSAIEPYNGQFLWVTLTCRNRGNTSKNVESLFAVVNEYGDTYGPELKGTAKKGCIEIRESLRPGKSIEGFLLFDVPEGHRYFLMVTDGGKDTYVAL